MFVFTSCTNNYIPKARVLASTLKSFHPDWTFCLLLGETPPDGFVLEDEPFDRLVTFDQLEIPEYTAWLFRHRVVEICTAAKGPALFHFLAREGHDKVMYLDPDIMVCNTLAPLETMLDSHGVLLTPHQLAPQETRQSIVDNELVAMKYGVFNLGFVAAARRGDGLRFSRWWRDRLMRYCYDDIPEGIFTDQRWCDLAPAFFQDLHIVRDPGCNAASWNLTDRTITRDDDGTFLANDGPLRFYHFTGFDSGAGDGMTARYAANMPAVHELWAIYRERLMASGHTALGKRRWAYAAFDDGTPITDAMRLLYREREDLQRTFPDPFIRPGFLDWYLSDHVTQRSLPRRIRRKLGSIRRKGMQVLNLYGGFPGGIPGAARHTLEKVRECGMLEAGMRIWRSHSVVVPHVEKPQIPLLHDMLQKQDSADFATLSRILDAAHTPVCVVEHDWGGGADAYCQKRITGLLENGRAVIRLRYVLDAERVEMTACHGDEHFHCEVSDLRELVDGRFPRIDGMIFNELAGWYYRHYNLPGMVAYVQDAVRAFTQIARHHRAHVEFLFHDYYAVCPTMNLLTPDHVYCGLGHTDATCDACALRGDPFSMARWREVWGELLSMADEVVFFSEDTRNAVRSVYTLRDEQVKLRPHVTEPLGPKMEISPEGPMRVAVVGKISQHKGADMVVRLARILDERMPEAAIVVFGELDAEDIPFNVTVLGQYARGDLASLLRKQRITVGFFSSIWPETFSFVAHELASVGLPLVSFDIGAQGAFVRTLPGSHVADAVNAEAVFEALRALDAARKAGG